MENVWERFDSIAKPQDVMEAKTQFTPVQEGVYKVLLEEILPSQSKNGLPMLKGKFRIIDRNRIVFYNQMLQNLKYPNMTAVNIAEAVAFVSGLVGEDVEFTGLGAFAELISQIPIGTEHWVEVYYGDRDYEKKFTKLKIVEEPEELDLGVDTEDVPF